MTGSNTRDKKYNFVEFTDTRIKHHGSYVSIGKLWRISFSADFIRCHSLGAMRRVDLYYDPENLAIGFHFLTDTQDPASFTLRNINPRCASRYIAAPRFFKNYKIDPAQNKRRYTYITVENEGMALYVIELKKNVINPGSPPRNMKNQML